jgi:hypothetical protein
MSLRIGPLLCPLTLHPPPPQDLGQVSGEELVGYLHEQGGYCLRKGLKDMGVSLDSHRSYGEWGGPGAGLCRAVQGCTGRYRAVQGDTGLYRAVQRCAGLYKTGSQGPAGPH